MGRSAYMTEVARSVRGSLGRFLAILGIVALGCGFYAGLQMCGPDMRIAADRWYDGCALWDLRVISSQSRASTKARWKTGTPGAAARSALSGSMAVETTSASAGNSRSPEPS